MDSITDALSFFRQSCVVGARNAPSTICCIAGLKPALL